MKQVGLTDERIKQITQEKELIQSEQNPEEIFQLLRKKIDGFNRIDLIKKALEFEEVLLPMVTEKLMRSNHDIFIENSFDQPTWYPFDSACAIALLNWSSILHKVKLFQQWYGSIPA